MLINETCKDCQIKKNINEYPDWASSEKIEIYQARVRDILDKCYGLNIYYLFLCKCEAFMKRFDVPQFTRIMTHEM